MKKTINKITTLIIASLVISSCTRDTNLPDSNGIYDDGYFVTNEGNFGSGNGSISFVSNDGIVENNVFVTTNSFPLGDVVQSMSIIDENIYRCKQLI